MTAHRFSVAEYYRLGESGLLDQRTELIEGTVIGMEPIGPWHASVVDILTQRFAEQAHDRFRVRVQQPIDLGADSLPQPDLVLCRPDRYREHHPGASDDYLIIEVADTTQDFDLVQKRYLYARAGIPEYWVVDLQGKVMTCLAREGVDLVERPVSGTRVSPIALQNASIELAELFG
jgi:Uma2 family endonuclease